MSKNLTLCASLLVTAMSTPAIAQVTYVGADNSVTSTAQMTNSNAAAANFDAAAPGANIIDFESAVPSDVTITGGSITNSSCGSVCGFNTTTGGQNFLSLLGGSATFTFASPVDAFGFYVTGLQSDLVPTETVTFDDGSTQTFNAPFATDGGGGFFGVTDSGKSITSFSYNATNDIVALDDVRYLLSSVGGVPEPSTWALMLLGFGAIGFAMRRNNSRPAEALA